MNNDPLHSTPPLKGMEKQKEWPMSNLSYLLYPKLKIAIFMFEIGANCMDFCPEENNFATSCKV